MVEYLRSNGLSPFAENVNRPGQAVTAADLRNLMGFRSLREGDQGRGEGKDPKIGASGRSTQPPDPFHARTTPPTRM